MAHPIHCDPRTLLKQLAIPLVQRLFEQRGELLDLPWSELRQKKQTAPIYAAWQRLPEDRRREVQIVFHEIAGAATELGIAAFAQEVKHAAPGDVWKFNACRSRLNKALWYYLSFPELFERATLFARADSLTTGRFAIRRDNLPRAPSTDQRHAGGFDGAGGGAARVLLADADARPPLPRRTPPPARW